MFDNIVGSVLKAFTFFFKSAKLNVFRKTPRNSAIVNPVLPGHYKQCCFPTLPLVCNEG